MKSRVKEKTFYQNKNGQSQQSELFSLYWHVAKIMMRMPNRYYLKLKTKILLSAASWS